MNFNQLLQKGEELAQSQGLTGGNSNSGSGSGSGSGNLQQYESYAKDAQTVYNDYNQQGSLSERAQKAYSDVQNNHKSGSSNQDSNQGSNQESNQGSNQQSN